MKNSILRLAAILGLSILISSKLIAQSPELLNYQAIIRGADGSPIVNTQVLIEMEILYGSTSGKIAYSESHTVTTNDYGLINILIGDGTSSDKMSDIEWQNGPYFLKTDVDGQKLSITQLLSVPYALYSERAGNGISSLQENHWDAAYSWGNHASQGYSPLTNDFTRDNDTIYYVDGNVGIGTKDPRSTLSVFGTTPNDSAIFEVKNSAGYTVFAVYNEGVRINIDEEYTGKGNKGGFAIGGFDRQKGPIQEYLRVTSDSTRVYINKNASDKGNKGGFAIGGFDGDAAKAETFNFVDLTPENYFIGHESGSSMTSGRFNSFFGYNAGMDNTTGSHNIFIGYKSGYDNKGGYNNIMFGDYAGYLNTEGLYNIFIGNGSGYRNMDGDYNTYIGYQSGNKGGYNTTDPSYNTYVGFQSGSESRTGEYNTFIGHRAGKSGSSASGSRNVFVGDSAGVANISGDNNIFVGKSAGAFNTAGDYNVALGSGAGYLNNGHYNVFIGYESGYNNVSGADSRFSKWNTFVGYQSGYGNTTGWHNMAIGYQAGLNNQSATNQFFIGNSAGLELIDGYGNTFIGHSAGRDGLDISHSTIVGYYAGVNGTDGDYNTIIGYAAGIDAEGDDNVFVGEGAGKSFVAGDENVVIGKNAGYGTTTGSGNVFIGYRAGYDNDYSTIENKLYIANDMTNNTEPLIYGDFASKYVVINGRTRPSTGYEFFVTGQAGGSSSWNLYSDEKLKKNISTIPGALNKVRELRGVNYEWKDSEMGESGIRMGFIAQEASKVVPEVVNTEGEFFTMQYAPITALLVEAIKEQQEQIDQLKNENAEISSLQEQNHELQGEIDELRSMVTNLQQLFNTLSIIKE